MTKDILKKNNKKVRCVWVGNDTRMIKYHDTLWGVPERRDRKIFEALVLDTFQAGLSWAIVLNKRDNFAQAFSNFDPKKVAKFSKNDVQRLLKDSGIIRNKLKIEATIANAQAFLATKKEFGTFAKYIWHFVDNKPIQNHHKKHSHIAGTTPLAQTISRDLKKRGFRFCGPTVVYAFMQGIGIVNDHLVECFRYKELLATPKS